MSNQKLFFLLYVKPCLISTTILGSVRAFLVLSDLVTRKRGNTLLTGTETETESSSFSLFYCKTFCLPVLLFCSFTPSKIGDKGNSQCKHFEISKNQIGDLLTLCKTKEQCFGCTML